MSSSTEPSVSAIDALRMRIAELEEVLGLQSRIQETLRIARQSPGSSVFDLLTLELANALGAECGLIGTLLPDRRSVRVIGFCVDGRTAPCFEYGLEGTPCDASVGKGVTIIPSGAGGRYPADLPLARFGFEGYCGAALFDSLKRPIGVIAFFTRRRLAEASWAESLIRVAASRVSAELERSQSEARLKSIFGSSMIGIVFWDSNGEILDANHAFLESVRYTREDLEQHRIRWREMTPSEHAAKDIQALEEIRVRGVCTPFEKEYLRKDGTRVPVLIGGSRITLAPLTGVAFVLDLSARMAAERSAQVADELNRQVISSMREGLCVHDRNLRYVHFNPQMEAITGARARDVVGKHPLEVFPVLKEMGIYSDLERSLQGETRTSPDLPYHPKGTSGVRWTSTQSSPLRDHTGAIIGVIAVVRDITELKGTEAALRESEQRLSDALKVTQDRVVQLEEQVQTRYSFASMVGKSPAMQEVYRRLRLAAESEVTVLLTGESGTGKELAAAAVHSLSHRRSRPFVAVNCSAIPEGILESELFGHVKGAFTGAARNKVGLFQAAEGGTLFLDEVGDMSPVLQVKVLRALQERAIRRVGDDQEVKVDVRLVTATNRNLPELIEKGILREDFYYRIRVFEIQLPTLRERTEDISLMVGHFIGELSRATGKRVRTIEPDALKHLMEYPWPGNVRELKNALEHAFVTVRGDRLTLQDLPFEIRMAAPSEPSLPSPDVDTDARARIVEALHRAGGRKIEAARRLGISRVTLWHRMRILGIDSSEGRRTQGARKR